MKKMLISLLLAAGIFGCLDSAQNHAKIMPMTHGFVAPSGYGRGHFNPHRLAALMPEGDTLTYEFPDGAGTIPRPGVNDYGFIALTSYLGTDNYIGPIVRVEQNGHFVVNIWAQTWGAAEDSDLVLTCDKVSFDGYGMTDVAPIGFRATVYPDLFNYWYTDSTMTPQYDPCWRVKIDPL